MKSSPPFDVAAYQKRRKQYYENELERLERLCAIEDERCGDVKPVSLDDWRFNDLHRKFPEFAPAPPESEPPKRTLADVLDQAAYACLGAGEISGPTFFDALKEASQNYEGDVLQDLFFLLSNLSGKENK